MADESTSGLTSTVAGRWWCGSGPRGKRLSVVRIDNSPAALAEAVTAAGDHPQVVLEATYGWYWAVDVLQELGATVHLAEPERVELG